MSFDFDAGKHAIYLWPAFAVSAAAFAWQLGQHLAAVHRERELVEAFAPLVRRPAQAELASRQSLDARLFGRLPAAAFAVRFPRRLSACCVRSVTGSCTRCAPVGFELLGNPRAGRGGRASTATCWSQSPAFPCASTGRSRTCSCAARSRSRPASAGEPIGGDAGVSSCCRRGIPCGPMRRSQATGSTQARSIAAASRSPSLPRDAATRNGTKHAAGVSTDSS